MFTSGDGSTDGIPMVDARVIALVLGIVGAGFGLAAAVTAVPALALAAGISALAAGIVALAGGTGTTRTERTEVDERDDVLDRTRQELADARAEISELRQRIERRAGHGSSPAGEQTTSDAGPMAGFSSAGADTSTSAAPEAVSHAGPEDTVDVSALTDPDSQLFSEAYFRVALQSRLASARRHLRPVSVCLLQVAEGPADSAFDAPAARVAAAIRETVREADIACRMGDGTYAVILEDTPENGAVWTVERTRRNLVSRSGPHTVWAGVACYPAHAFSGDELLEQSRAALGAAKEWKQDRIEVAVVEG